MIFGNNMTPEFGFDSYEFHDNAKKEKQDIDISWYGFLKSSDTSVYEDFIKQKGGKL